MHRNRIKSTSNIQEEELPSIEANFSFVNDVLKWNIADLNRFISLLQHRLNAEEAYIASLTKIPKTHLTPDAEAATYFGDTETTLFQATAQYERSLGQLLSTRRAFAKTIEKQISLLSDFKASPGGTRARKTKQQLAQTNEAYYNFRTRDILKLQNKYSTRCLDLHNAQQQLQQQVQHQNHQSFLTSDTDSKESESSRLSSEEPRPRLSTDNDSISSVGDSSAKKAVTNFMAQMRTHVVNAAQEVSKQNARCARLATEIATADAEYREGIRKLETLRRKQIGEATKALQIVENLLSAKTDACKGAMHELVLNERITAAEESRLNDYVARAVDDIDSKRDIHGFFTEYQKRGYVQPSAILYRNYNHELLFGSTLNEYANEHKCTVPLIVYKCIDAVERMGGLQKEGIYRISGRQSNVDHLKSMFEQNEQGLDLEQTKFDVFTIAAVLKVYLRELKEPLFQFGYQTRMEYATLETHPRLRRLEAKIAALARPHRDTLYVLMRHLSNEVNKMNLQNLSVVFTPTIFQDHSGNGAPGEWRGDRVFEDMLTYYEPLFHHAEARSKMNSNAGGAANMSPATYGRAPSSQAGSGISTPISANPGMLLTAPLNPSNLGLSNDRQGGYDGQYQQQQQQQQQPSTPQQQRSTSLTTTATVNPQQKHELPPIPQNTGLSPAQQQKIPPRSTSSSRNVSPSSSTITEEAASLIGMAAMGAVLETSATTESPTTGGEQRADPRPTITTATLGMGGDEVISPVSPISPGEGKHKGEAVPPRQDSLRVQIGHQQIQQQQQQQLSPSLPPPISTSPLPTNTNAAATATGAVNPTKQPSRLSPTGPQTPTIAMGGSLTDHIPSTAIIVENDYVAPRDGRGSGDKHLDEGQD
ncbi:hypothetical protein BX666DRAFT_2023061 [Dichotomocladium elegans]|nr:hypothetical protein BX666DRAFT_2023061 [Dichotomocladium elegans]